MDAERFNAAINSPPGKEGQIVEKIEEVKQNVVRERDSMDVDDEFFHVTCHVDPVLKQKMERGDFVDLEKLLPKSKGRAFNENKLDLVYKDGHSFFIPAPSENKINGVRRWEQAFRVYAAIYSQANPGRAAEIWQYVHVINTAASAYAWENVSNYDYTFRQLMAYHPQRNWGKIYNQMWNMSMRDPITKNQQYYQNQNLGQKGKTQQHGKSGSSNQNGGKFKPKVKYCWAFNNKGNCSDKDCKFISKCSYCDSSDHGLCNCAKAKANAR